MTTTTYISVHDVDTSKIRIAIYGPGLCVRLGDTEVTVFPEHVGKNDQFDKILHKQLCKQLFAQTVAMLTELENDEGP